MSQITVSSVSQPHENRRFLQDWKLYEVGAVAGIGFGLIYAALSVFFPFTNGLILRNLTVGQIVQNNLSFWAVAAGLSGGSCALGIAIWGVGSVKHYLNKQKEQKAAAASQELQAPTASED